MPKNRDLVPGDHFDNSVTSRRIEEHEQKLEALRLALIEGEESVISGPLEMRKIKNEARAQLGEEPTPLP